MLTNLVTQEALEVQVSLVQQAFATMADLAVFPVQSSPVIRTVFVGSLRYSGECTGEVRLECSEAMAYAFTQRVIGGSQPKTLDGDVKDAIGELVNTIGGNLKGLLSPGVRLTMPTVGCCEALDATTAECLSCLSFHSQFGALRLLLIEM